MSFLCWNRNDNDIKYVWYIGTYYFRSLWRNFEICLKIAWNTNQKHVWPPFKLKGCLFILIYVNFNSKMQKKQYLRVHRQKISTASLEIAQTASARFYNYDHQFCDVNRRARSQLGILTILSSRIMYLKVASLFFTDLHEDTALQVAMLPIYIVICQWTNLDWMQVHWTHKACHYVEIEELDQSYLKTTSC